MKCLETTLEMPVAEAIRGGRGTAVDYVPLVVLPTIALMLRTSVPARVFMWSMAFGIYAGCKWLTWRRAWSEAVSAWRSLGYLLAWPGLDAKEFLSDRQAPSI